MTEETNKWPPHLDAVSAAPNNHRVLLEDDQIRVLEVTVRPGEREELHQHQWPSVMVVLSRPSYTNYDSNGSVIPPAGGTPTDPLPRAVRLPPQATHAKEVEADAMYPFQGIRVEFKV